MVADRPTAAPRGEPGTERSHSKASCLVQLVWSLGGAGVVAVLGVTILREHPWTFTYKDGLYWAVVACMIAARSLDFALLHGRTMVGTPLTARDVRSYVAGLAPATALLWGLVQSFRV